MYNTFLSNVKNCGVEGFITPVKKDSIVAAASFENEYFDFIFIDANHDYSSVISDIESWNPKLNKTGIISGDDYHPYWIEVMKAVDEKFGERVKKDYSPCWYIKL